MASTRTAEPMFELRKSDIQGRGAFATRRIRKGTRIIEYVGEKITSEEGDERYDDSAMGRHHTFLFSLDNGYVIDAAVGGNEARFINHSCDPNCEAIIEKGHIYIDALRTIQPGEELAYDYAYERSDDHTDEDEKLYKCRCGAANCRGTILAPLKKKKPSRARPAKQRQKRKGATKGGRKKGGTKKPEAGARRLTRKGEKTGMDRSKAKKGARAKRGAGR